MQQLWVLKPELAPKVGKLRAMKGVLALGGRQISEDNGRSDEERRLHDADRLVDALDAPDTWLLAHVVSALLGLPTTAVEAVAAGMRAPQQDWRRPTRVNFDVFLRSQARRQWRTILDAALHSLGVDAELLLDLLPPGDGLHCTNANGAYCIHTLADRLKSAASGAAAAEEEGGGGVSALRESVVQALGRFYGMWNPSFDTAGEPWLTTAIHTENATAAVS